MEYYIYNADMYCVECGEDIKQRIRAEGQTPATPWDETSYDSGDQPLICAAGKYCLNAEILSSYVKMGRFLRNPLTREGERYVEDLYENDVNDFTLMLMRFYNLF